jgi:hypothetical protein
MSRTKTHHFCQSYPCPSVSSVVKNLSFGLNQPRARGNVKFARNHRRFVPAFASAAAGKPFLANTLRRELRATDDIGTQLAPRRYVCTRPAVHPIS